MNRRPATMWLAAIPLIGLLTACGSATGIETEGGKSSITIASSITGSSFLAVTAGIEQGIFEEHGVNLDVVKVKSTAEGTAALSSGDADVAAMLTEGAIAARSSGADMKIIGNLLTQDQHTLYVQQGIESIKELNGTKFGVVGPGSGTEMLAKSLVKDAGLDVDSVEYVPTGAASTQLSSLVSGQIDAAGLVPPYDVTAAGEGMEHLADYRDLFPDMTPQVLVTSGANIENEQDALQGFLEAYTESAQWVVDNESKAVAILAEDAQISDAEAQESYEFAKPDYAVDMRVEEKGLQAWLDMSAEYGKDNNNQPTIDELYDSSFAQRAEK